jgi:hypothetical protein
MEDWLNRLNNDVFLVFHHLDLFKKLGEIIDANEQLKKMDNTFLAWMKDAMTSNLVMGISRLCDRDKRTASFVRFLEALKNEISFLSRKKYVSLYTPDTQDLAHKDFDNLAGAGLESFPTDFIYRDIEELTESSSIKKILTYRHQYIAHSDHQREAAPTYNDLFQAFEVIESIIKKYNLLIRATSLGTVTPVMQGNWEEVLTIPWLDSKRDEP